MIMKTLSESIEEALLKSELNHLQDEANRAEAIVRHYSRLFGTFGAKSDTSVTIRLPFFSI